MQNSYDFFSNSSKIFVGLMGEISAPGKNGRERKERKKGGDEGLNGFKLPFPLGSSFHSSLGPKSPHQSSENFLTC
jgi:hypothetical protein